MNVEDTSNVMDLTPMAQRDGSGVRHSSAGAGKSVEAADDQNYVTMPIKTYDMQKIRPVYSKPL